MDLRTFVAESLVQIVQGVVDSAERISAAGGAVSPAYDANGASAAIGTTPVDRKPVYLVEFDIAVTVAADSAKDATESLSVAGVLAQWGGGSREQRPSGPTDLEHRQATHFSPVPSAYCQN